LLSVHASQCTDVVHPRARHCKLLLGVARVWLCARLVAGHGGYWGIGYVC
jgi:hypothetical protein